MVTLILLCSFTFLCNFLKTFCTHWKPHLCYFCGWFHLSVFFLCLHGHFTPFEGVLNYFNVCGGFSVCLFWKSLCSFCLISWWFCFAMFGFFYTCFGCFVVFIHHSVAALFFFSFCGDFVFAFHFSWLYFLWLYGVFQQDCEHLCLSVDILNLSIHFCGHFTSISCLYVDILYPFMAFCGHFGFFF